MPLLLRQGTHQGTAKAGDNTEEISLLGSSTEHATLIVTDDALPVLGAPSTAIWSTRSPAPTNQVISSGDWTDNIAPDFFSLPRQLHHHPRRDLAQLTQGPDPAITGPSTISRSVRSR